MKTKLVFLKKILFQYLFAYKKLIEFTRLILFF